VLLCLVATASRPEWPATSEVNRAEQPLPGTTAFDSLRSSSLRRPRKGLEELMPKDQFQKDFHTPRGATPTADGRSK
jgi:hypothetical protein